MSVIDPVKHEVRTKIAFSVPGMRGEAIQPVGINFTRNGKTGFVALGPANRIAVVARIVEDRRRGQGGSPAVVCAAAVVYLFVATLYVLSPCSNGINITRNGKTGFVALGPANRIAVVDGTTHQVQKYLLVGQRVWHMAFTPDEKYLLTTNGLSNDISVIDVASLRVIDTIQVGELPWGITISRR